MVWQDFATIFSAINCSSVSLSFTHLLTSLTWWVLVILMCLWDTKLQPRSHTGRTFGSCRLWFLSACTRKLLRWWSSSQVKKCLAATNAMSLRVRVWARNCLWSCDDGAILLRWPKTLPVSAWRNISASMGTQRPGLSRIFGSENSTARSSAEKLRTRDKSSKTKIPDSQWCEDRNWKTGRYNKIYWRKPGWN